MEKRIGWVYWLDADDSNFGIIREQVLIEGKKVINEIGFFPEDEGLKDLKHGDIVSFEIDSEYDADKIGMEVAINVQRDTLKSYQTLKKAA